MKEVQPIFSRKDLEAVKEHLRGGVVEGAGLRNYVLAVMGFNVGLRISDLLNLTVGDVLRVDRGGRRRVVKLLEIEETKTKRRRKRDKVREIVLNASARKALRDYLIPQELPASYPLFPSREKDRATGAARSITRKTAYRILNGAAETVGIEEHIGTHTLRKTFGYHAYQRILAGGGDITKLQKIFGHASPDITLRYIGITRQDERNIYEGLCL